MNIRRAWWCVLVACGASVGFEAGHGATVWQSLLLIPAILITLNGVFQGERRL